MLPYAWDMIRDGGIYVSSMRRAVSNLSTCVLNHENMLPATGCQSDRIFWTHSLVSTLAPSASLGRAESDSDRRLKVCYCLADGRDMSLRPPSRDYPPIFAISFLHVLCGRYGISLRTPLCSISSEFNLWWSHHISHQSLSRQGAGQSSLQKYLKRWNSKLH